MARIAYMKFRLSMRVLVTCPAANLPGYQRRGGFFVLGASGAGKTTPFNLLSGILRPTKDASSSMMSMLPSFRSRPSSCPRFSFPCLSVYERCPEPLIFAKTLDASMSHADIHERVITIARNSNGPY